MVLCRGAWLALTHKELHSREVLCKECCSAPESSSFLAVSLLRAACEGAWECWVTRLCSVSSPIRQAQCRFRQSQMYHFLWVCEECHCHPVLLTEEGEEARPGLRSVSAAEKSQGHECAARRDQPHTLLLAGRPFCSTVVQESSCTRLAGGLWRGDGPAWLAATCMIRECIRRATLKWVVSGKCLLRSTL